MPESGWRQRTMLAQERSTLALVVIAALLLTHSHAWLGVSAALLVAAAGLGAHSPRTLAAATGLAAASAALVVVT